MPPYARNGRCPLKCHYWQGKPLSNPQEPGPCAPEQPEEVLVADARAGLTPADMVERKLLYVLGGAPVAGSHVRMAGLRIRGWAEG
jgi:hypothetical protein